MPTTPPQDESNPGPPRNPPKGRSRRSARSAPDLQPDAAPPKAPPDDAGKREKTSTAPRGLVCPACGKFHDVTASPVGSTFHCYCGQELIVPPPAPERGVTPRDARARRLEELRTRLLYTNIAMVLSFLVCILLISASMYLILGEGQRGNGICAGLAAIAFLVAGTVAAREGRRIKSEIAGTGDEE